MSAESQFIALMNAENRFISLMNAENRFIVFHKQICYTGTAYDFNWDGENI